MKLTIQTEAQGNGKFKANVQVTDSGGGRWTFAEVADSEAEAYWKALYRIVSQKSGLTVEQTKKLLALTKELNIN